MVVVRYELVERYQQFRIHYLQKVFFVLLVIFFGDY